MTTRGGGLGEGEDGEGEVRGEERRDKMDCWDMSTGGRDARSHMIEYGKKVTLQENGLRKKRTFFKTKR